MNRRFLALTVTLISLAAPAACRTRTTPSDDGASGSSAARNSNPGSVSFKIAEVGREKVSDGEEVTWLAIHESRTGKTQFKIKLILKEAAADSPFVFAKGAFLREKNSQPSDFLRQIANALEAKKTKGTQPATDRLDFGVAILGQHLNRGSGSDVIAGAFGTEPKGDWIATKVFVAGGEGEFYLNLNSKEGGGEISIKDPEYGDIVIQELSRLF